MVFGIPTVEEATSLMDGAVSDNTTDLTSVAAQAIQQVGAGLLDSRAALNTVQGRLRSRLGKMAQLSNADLDRLGNQFDTILGNAVVNNLADQPAPAIPTPDAGVTPFAAPIPGQAPPPLPLAAGTASAVGSPVGQAVPAPPLIIGKWYCVYIQVDDGHMTCAGKGIYQYPFASTIYPADYLAANVLDGPFDSAETANAACCAILPPVAVDQPPPPPGGQPGPQPPPVIPPQPGPQPPPELLPPENKGTTFEEENGYVEPTETPVPDITCDTQGMRIPPVGSREFCQMIDQLKIVLHNLGVTLIDWVFAGQIPDFKVCGTDGGVAQGVLTELSPAAGLAAFGSGKVLELLIDCGTDWAKQFKDRLLKLINSLQCVSSCDIGAIVGVVGVKFAISMLKRMRFGTDAAIWATFDMTVELRPLERVIDYVIEYVCPSEIPSISETMECVLRNTIEEDQARCWMAMRGADFDVWQPVLLSRREQPTYEQLIQWGRRNNIPDDLLDPVFKQIGIISKDDLSILKELYDELPTIGDHLHWLQRNVFSTEYVKRYHLLDGFAPDDTIRTIPGYEDYTSLNVPPRGFFWERFGHDLRARGMKIEYAANHYAAHWIQPSPEQMKQFVYRLRPGRVEAGHEFTEEDFDRILQEQDYNVLSRRWFTDTIHPVPAISYVKRMFQLCVIDEEQLLGYHMDLGYKEEDAKNFVGVDKVDRVRHLVTSGHGWTPQAMAGAYAIGQLSADDVLFRMDSLGYPQDIAEQLLDRSKAEFDRQVLIRARSRAIFQMVTTVKQSITAGIMTVEQGSQALQGTGFPKNYADSIAAMSDTAASAALVKQGVSRIRSSYLRGEIDLDYSHNALLTLGIVANRAAQLIALWQVENTPNRKRRTARDIVNDVASGHMEMPEAIVRLTNLGYPDADRRLFLADAQGKMAKMESAKQASALKAGRQRAAEIAKLAREAERQRKAFLGTLRRLEPVPKLQKWLKLGIITREYFDGRMRLYDYSQGEISAYAAEATSAAPKAGKQPPGVGPGAPGGP